MGAPFVHLSVGGGWPIQAHITALLSFLKKMYKVGLNTDHFKIWNSTYQLHSFAFMYPQQEPPTSKWWTKLITTCPEKKWLWIISWKNSISPTAHNWLPRGSETGTFFWYLLENKFYWTVLGYYPWGTLISDCPM